MKISNPVIKKAPSPSNTTETRLSIDAPIIDGIP